MLFPPDVWGDHMHHGYYPTPNYKNHTAGHAIYSPSISRCDRDLSLAQVDMIDRSLRWAYGSDEEIKASKIVDVGW